MVRLTTTPPRAILVCAFSAGAVIAGARFRSLALSGDWLEDHEQVRIGRWRLGTCVRRVGARRTTASDGTMHLVPRGQPRAVCGVGSQGLEVHGVPRRRGQVRGIGGAGKVL